MFFWSIFIGGVKLRRPSLSASSRTKQTTESSSTEKPSTLRPTLKYKNIDRPNIKALFPSLHSRQSTTESPLETDSTDPNESTEPIEIDFIETTQSARNITRTPHIRTSTPLKFNSKIRSAIRNTTSPTNIRPQPTTTLPLNAARNLPQHHSAPVICYAF